MIRSPTGGYFVQDQNTRCHTICVNCIDVEKLKKRFNKLPIHRKCYFQSYHPVDCTMKDISKMINNPELATAFVAAAVIASAVNDSKKAKYDEGTTS